MKTFLLALIVSLSAGAASAQEAKPAKKPSGPYQICLYPNPCAGRAKPAPAKPSVEVVPADPLTRAVVNGAIMRGEDGIVSSIRLSPEHTGVDHDQIITRGTGLRDALAPAATGAALPASVLPASKDGAKGAAEDEWASVDSTGAAAGQLNEMRDERKALKAGGEGSHAAAGRMWKSKK